MLFGGFIMSFKSISQNALKELGQVFDRITDVDVRDFLEIVKKSERIFTLGAGREGLATKSFAMRLTHLGKRSFWLWDDTTPAMGKGDLLVIANGSAETGHVAYIAKEAVKTGADIALVTTASKGTIVGLAKVVLKVPAEAYLAQGDFVKSTQLMGNLFEQSLFIIFDVLVMQLKEEMGIEKEDMIDRHRNVE